MTTTQIGKLGRPPLGGDRRPGPGADEWHAGFEKGWDMKHLIALTQIVEGRENVAR